MFRLGYNTNGPAHHRVLDAFERVAVLGYEALFVTPDVGQSFPLEEELGAVLTHTRLLKPS